ncbi:MAG: hypothetical protein ACLQU2_13470 [Candidatus Binataceae bacterium]
MAPRVAGIEAHPARRSQATEIRISRASSRWRRKIEIPVEVFEIDGVGRKDRNLGAALRRFE